MSEETLNIFQKLAKVRKRVDVLKKESKAYGYNYVKEDAILARIKPAMEKYGLSLIPRVAPDTTEVRPYHYMKTKVTKTGEIYEEHVNEMLVSSDMEWVWVNDDNPGECVRVPWAMVGQQSDASQAFGSGLSYSERYFLLAYFNIPTVDDDPDKWRSRQKQYEEEGSKAVAAQTIEILDGLVRTYTSEHPDSTEAVLGIITKYVKSGDYRKITEPALAAKLLQEFKNTFMKEDK